MREGSCWGCDLAVAATCCAEALHIADVDPPAHPSRYWGPSLHVACIIWPNGRPNRQHARMIGPAFTFYEIQELIQAARRAHGHRNFLLPPKGSSYMVVMTVLALPSGALARRPLAKHTLRPHSKQFLLPREEGMLENRLASVAQQARPLGSNASS